MTRRGLVRSTNNTNFILQTTRKQQKVRFFFAFFFLKLSSRQWGKSGDKTGSTWVERREKWEGEGGRIQNKGNTRLRERVSIGQE